MRLSEAQAIAERVRKERFEGMKRTPLKRKTGLRRGKPPRRSRKPIARHSKREIPKLLLQAWKACSQYIVYRDGLLTTGTTRECLCITCGARRLTTGFTRMQAGHWRPGRTGTGLNIFDERAIHGQCDFCNNFLPNMQAIYTAKMKLMYPEDVLQELILQANTPHKWGRTELVSIRKDFEHKTAELLR